jgi:hypothetical protein
VTDPDWIEAYFLLEARKVTLLPRIGRSDFFFFERKILDDSLDGAHVVLELGEELDDPGEIDRYEEAVVNGQGHRLGLVGGRFEADDETDKYKKGTDLASML